MDKLWSVDPENVNTILRGYSTYRTPLPQRKPTEVFPGVYSFDETFLEFVEVMTGMLNDHPMLQPTLDENLMCYGNGVHTDFTRLMTVAGYASTPLSYPSVDNSKLCDDMGIPNDFRSDRHRQIFDEMFDLIFGHFKHTRVNVPKKSTFGVPCMSVYDADYKREFAKFAFANVDKILNYVGKRDFNGLAREFGVIFCYVLNRRGQVDNVNKVRHSNSIDFALSGGKKGERIKVDKHVVINGRDYPGFSAMRERVVQGASWAVNCLLQVMYTGHMYAMFEMFPDTFHETDANETARKCHERGEAFFSDVTQYDETMRKFLTDRMFDRLRNFWDERLVDMGQMLFTAPYYTRPLEAGDRGRGLFVGDPFNPDQTQINAGNRSGHAGTSLVAKTMKVFDTLTVIDDLLKDVAGNVYKYLTHDMNVIIFNNGDDEGVAGSPEFMAKFRKARTDIKNHGYFVVEGEVGQAFSGRLIDWKNNIARAKKHTSLEKCWVPERSIGGVFRPNWAIGFVTRSNNLMEDTEYGHYVLEIQSKAWRDIMQPVYGPYANILSMALEQTEFSVEGLSRIDAEVLEDESKIRWRYRPEDLSPEVASKVLVELDLEDSDWALSKYRGFVI